MKLGSPGFRGNRLVEAREVRGVTGKALADVVGVSAGSISHYENGRQTPSGEVLSAMASALGFPEKFFFGRDRPTRQGTVFFRSGATLPQRAKNAVMWRIGWIQEILEYLNQYLELPPVHIFDAGFGDDPTAISVEDIERAAADLRTFWGLKDGAISDTVLLAELHGIVVSRLRLNEDREDALSEPKIDNYRDCILLNADKNCAVRSRLDVGHELGHLVLHRHVPQDVKEIHHNLIEKQAFRFAGALLLPATSFFSDFYVPTIDNFRRLKPKWKTSIGAMIKRCSDAGILDEAQSQKLWIRYRRQKWHKREPLDDELPVEMPRLLRRSFDALFREGLQTKADLRNALSISQRDIEQVASLPAGYLDDGVAPVKMLPIRVRDDRPKNEGPATIYRFGTDGP